MRYKKQQGRIVKTATTVIRRTQPCGCGCKGSDPWHARQFSRVIRDVLDVPFETNQTDTYRNVLTGKGVVTVPWGTAVVYRMQATFDGKVYSPDWVFAPFGTQQDWPPACVNQP